MYIGLFVCPPSLAFSFGFSFYFSKFSPSPTNNGIKCMANRHRLKNVSEKRKKRAEEKSFDDKFCAKGKWYLTFFVSWERRAHTYIHTCTQIQLVSTYFGFVGNIMTPRYRSHRHAMLSLSHMEAFQLYRSLRSTDPAFWTILKILLHKTNHLRPNETARFSVFSRSLYFRLFGCTVFLVLRKFGCRLLSTLFSPHRLVIPLFDGTDRAEI